MFLAATPGSIISIYNSATLGTLKFFFISGTMVYNICNGIPRPHPPSECMLFSVLFQFLPLTRSPIYPIFLILICFLLMTSLGFQIT